MMVKGTVLCDLEKHLFWWTLGPLTGIVLTLAPRSMMDAQRQNDLVGLRSAAIFREGWMGRYIIDATDLAYAREFLLAPIGYHSPGLQRVLNHLRGAYSTYKYVLVVEKRYSRWKLGKLPLRRGAAVELVDGVHYSDLLDAERDIFKRRWRDLTGDDLDALLASSDQLGT